MNYVENFEGTKIMAVTGIEVKEHSPSNGKFFVRITGIESSIEIMCDGKESALKLKKCILNSGFKLYTLPVGKDTEYKG